MLLLDDDDELPVEATDEEQTLAVRLGSAGLIAIDEALQRHAASPWLKGALVVHRALEEAGGDPWDQPVLHLHVRRLIHLVESGALQAQGNLRKPRWSEVRLP